MVVLKGQRKAGARGLFLFENTVTFGDFVLLGEEKHCPEYNQVAKVTFSSCD